ncbi:MAG TPA: heme-copper oxidase subunit III [Deltaproteobacteria bacterium]|nr:heme-copper oxidase subunit III [Deltaproteobacteria bacterium]
MADYAAEHDTQWHTSYWPLMVSVGTLFLVPLSFTFYFVYSSALWAVISLGIGAPLTLGALAGWVREGLADEHHYGMGLSVWAMPFFILAEALLFIGFFAGYWVTRLQAPLWPPAGTPEMSLLVPIIMTVILVSSSVTIHVAEGKLEEGDRAGFNSWLIATMVLGAVFLGFTAMEWSVLIGEGFTTSTNIFASSFYSITGFHASHVLVGLAIFVAVLLPALGGTVNKHFVAAASMYWHFVDVVWFFVVSQIYFW